MKINETNWEERYQTGDMPWEKGEPSPGLVDFLAGHPELPKGTVCVPGCGTGHDVRACAMAGFSAYGYDLAPSAIRLSKAKTKAAACGSPGPGTLVSWALESVGSVQWEESS